MEKSFRTLRGCLAGKEREETPYFDHSATLRISGDIPDMDEISARLGLQPKHSYRKGEKRNLIAFHTQTLRSAVGHGPDRPQPQQPFIRRDQRQVQDLGGGG